MDRTSIMLLFFVQVIGATFYAILLAAYVLPFPSMDVLIGEPLFRSLLSVFGCLFLLSTLVSIIAFKISKKNMNMQVDKFSNGSDDNRFK